MKFQNPFDLFNNYLDKSKNNIEPFDNEIEDVSNEIKDGLKGYAAEENKDDEKTKKEFDYGIGFMIIILVTVFIIQCIAYFFSLKIEKKRGADEMIKILDNPTWSFPFFVSMCFDFLFSFFWLFWERFI